MQVAPAATRRRQEHAAGKHSGTPASFAHACAAHGSTAPVPGRRQATRMCRQVGAALTRHGHAQRRLHLVVKPARANRHCAHLHTRSVGAATVGTGDGGQAAARRLRSAAVLCHAAGGGQEHEAPTLNCRSLPGGAGTARCLLDASASGPAMRSARGSVTSACSSADSTARLAASGGDRCGGGSWTGGGGGGAAPGLPLLLQRASKPAIFLLEYSTMESPPYDERSAVSRAFAAPTTSRTPAATRPPTRPRMVV